MSLKADEIKTAAADSSSNSTIRWRVAAAVLAAAAVLCLTAGIALPHLAEGVFSQKLTQLLPIIPDSVAYSSWVSSELRFQVWLWNITNPWAVLKEGARPHLEQVGPFTFAETRTRDGVKFFENNTVSYDDVRSYYFQPDQSVGNMLNYTITNVNLPYLAIALKMRSQSYYARVMAQRLFQQFRGGIFVNRTVHELLIGYEDPVIQKVRPILIRLGQRVPERFGLLVGKNGTAKGTALIGTGAAGLDQLSQMRRWNGQAKLTVWPGEFGNRLNGSSDGSMFPPPVTSQSSLRVFTPDLCRSANFAFAGDATVQGIPVLRFQVAKTAMMSAESNPENAAFCTPRCLDSGVLNLTVCLPGNPPIVASAPHFHGAPTYRAAVSLKPEAPPSDGQDEFDFNTRLEIEPNTGLLLKAARRMQINAALEKVEGFPDTDAFGSLLLMPYAWLNESGGIRPEAAARFRGRVLRPMQLAQLVSRLLLAASLALLILFCVVLCLEFRLRAVQKLRSARRQEQPIESFHRDEADELAMLYSDLAKTKPHAYPKDDDDEAPKLQEKNKPMEPEVEFNDKNLPTKMEALPETDIV